jgi:protein-S-isoprenylcysteine O-methyltransferase Ste14
MRYISIGCIAAFYIFFFARAFLLKKKLGKTIKANDFVLNLSILCAGLTSVLYILQKTVPALKAFFPVFSESFGFELAGTILLAAGLVISSLASLGLGRSWRIGVNEEDATQLVTGGLYSLSRNPYFLSYDID